MSVIPGGVGLAEMESNIAAAAAALPADLWAELRREGLLHPEAPAG